MKLNENCPVCQSDDWNDCGLSGCFSCNQICDVCGFEIGGEGRNPYAGQFSLDGNEFFPPEELERRLKLRSFE